MSPLLGDAIKRIKTSIYYMNKNTELKYLPPIAKWSRMESEGIICLSATVTVDEHRNVNADETVSEPYIEDPIVF